MRSSDIPEDMPAPFVGVKYPPGEDQAPDRRPWVDTTDTCEVSPLPGLYWYCTDRMVPAGTPSGQCSRSIVIFSAPAESIASSACPSSPG